MGRPLNIIIIIADALRVQNLSIYGYHKLTTPRLSKIAREGLVFKNVYATTDQTDPSFTTILSGRYPLIHGIVRHGPDITSNNIKIFNMTGTQLVSELLAKHGYKTIAVDWLGRWHRRGYHVYGPSSYYRSRKLFNLPMSVPLATYMLSKALNWRMYKIFYRILSKFGYSNNLSSLSIFDIVQEFFRIIKDKQPFFLLIHVWDTHTPFHNIPKFLLNKFYNGECKETVTSMSQRIKHPIWRYLTLTYHLKGIKCIDEIEPRYDASINHLDYTLYELIEAMKDTGIYDNSVVIFTSDHGENLLRNGVFIGHGGLFQRVLRVPLIILGQQVPFHKEINTPVQHVDISPTILNIAGINVSSSYYLDGKNLIDLVETEEPPRSYIFAISSTAPKRYAIIDLETMFKLVYSPSRRHALDKFGGIWFNDIIELYDLTKDHDDTNNLAEMEHELVRNLTKKLNSIVRSLERTRLKLITKHKFRTGG